jgi:hypothetical protein
MFIFFLNKKHGEKQRPQERLGNDLSLSSCVFQPLTPSIFQQNLILSLFDLYVMNLGSTAQDRARSVEKTYVLK